MPEIECGFDDDGLVLGCDRLVSDGPTLFVDIGFDPQFDPADTAKMPILALKQVAAVIDTGATISCIDKSIAAALHLPVVDKQNFSGIGGLYETEMHSAQIHVPSLNFVIHGQFAGVDLLGGGQQHLALIGRTFLRYMKMTYDGTTGKVSRP
jgi:hypothetical protein